MNGKKNSWLRKGTQSCASMKIIQEKIKFSLKKNKSKKLQPQKATSTCCFFSDCMKSTQLEFNVPEMKEKRNALKIAILSFLGKQWLELKLY